MAKSTSNFVSGLWDLGKATVFWTFSPTASSMAPIKHEPRRMSGYRLERKGAHGALVTRLLSFAQDINQLASNAVWTSEPSLCACTGCTANLNFGWGKKPAQGRKTHNFPNFKKTHSLKIHALVRTH
jgi:hypothetical protein